MLLGSVNTYFISWNSGKQLPRPKSIDKIKDLPHVEIFIPCCKEPLYIIKNTVESVFEISYPREKLEITIADDGNCEILENYICTMQEENLMINIKYKNRKVIKGNSKAGNINDTLYSSESISTKSLILILDCDMQCSPEILSLLVPYFYMDHNVFDENLAFVQSPQSFLNIERRDILGQHYVYFYKIIMKSWANWGCVPCCGTNVLFSRKVLEEIGGFQYGSVTEDFLTSMYLHSKGYKSKYCETTLAHGLAPFTLDDFYKQRFRWALGGIQLLKYIPKVCGKLSLVQYWIYFNSAVFTLCTPLLIFLIMSMEIVTFVHKQFFGNIWYTYYFGSYMFFHILILLILFYPVSYLYLIRSFQETIFMVNCNFMVFLYTVFNLPYSFKITPKNKSNKIVYDIIWCLPFFAYYAFALFVLSTKKMTIPGYIWLTIICFQMFPPIEYLLGTACSKIFGLQ
jgi:cellulose synthase/poly-beta-1,6-N-acetylglucosamine synthase-like glycosyltransferase